MYQLVNTPYITNFHVTPTDFEETQTMDYNQLTPFGTGVERYEYLLNNYSNISDIEDIKEVLYDLFFTKAYLGENPPRPSEYIGDHGDYILTTQDLYHPERFNHIHNLAKQEYTNRKRDGKTWQSVHSVIYDMENLKMYIGNQEQEINIEFELTNDYNIIETEE